jgi:hypothetical protein
MAALLEVFNERDNRIRLNRVFRDRLNPLDYLRDIEIIERYRLPRHFIFELVNIVREDIERPTARSHAIPATLQVNHYMQKVLPVHSVIPSTSRDHSCKFHFARADDSFSLCCFNRLQAVISHPE